MLKQIGLVTWMNIKSLPSRLGSSLVVVVGIAGVVGVLISVMAMSTGLQDTLINTGSGDRVIVMRDGANFEAASFLPVEVVQIITSTPGILKMGSGVAASAEMVTSVNQNRKVDDTTVGVTVRGIDGDRISIRPDIKLIDGRMFQSGIREVIVGQVTQMSFKNLSIGDSMLIQNAPWEIVGVFKSGDSHESGMLTDATTLMSAHERSSANSVVLVLDAGVTPESFKDSLTNNTNLLLTVVTEKEYYEQAAGNLSQLLFIVTNVVAAIMALGALFGALNTMYSAVSSRSVEIATLRALGFGSTCVVVSVLTEALLLAIAGALLGAFLAWLFFAGDLVSVSSIVFQLEVTPALLMTGVAWACGVGFIGGLFPAIRAARLPIVIALREM